MGMDVIVDGYNAIGAERGMQGALEHKRNWLIQQVAAYQRLKNFAITIVFDGWQTGSGKETEEKREGLRIVYSRYGEKADAVVVRLAKEKGSGCVVVTSDREIRSAVERFGAVAIYADEFNRILRSVEHTLEDSGNDGDDKQARAKKGNPRQLSKAERNRQDKLKKLRVG
ncbi:MAG: NYN domain-containing protein [Deltaproteobacteria bacterium]|nr:NYN domain-containing protein [Deltaproteobacteria bacterium]